MPGKYFLKSAGAPQGWTFKGATIGGRDITDTPFEIEGSDVGGVVLTFTDRPSSLAGTVTGSERQRHRSAGGGDHLPRRTRAVDQLRHQPAAPAQRPRRHQGRVHRSRTCHPGRYYVAAVREALAAEWQDPKFLETLANEATPVTIGEGQQMTQALKVVR